MQNKIKKPQSTKFIFYIYLLLTTGTLICFWQVHNFSFINYDDDLYVYENPYVLSGLTADGVIQAFTAPHVGNWLPLTWLSFMLDSQLFGVNPGRMHLVNMLLHIANTLLLFMVLRKMTGSLWPSAFVAAAFALHPMHVESVAWITERKDVLSTFFLLLTLAAYVSYVRRRRLFSYLLTVLLFVFGLLAKPMLVTLPLLLLLLDYWPLNRFEPQTVKTSGRKSVPAPDKRRILYRIIAEKIPFFVLSAVSSAITFISQKSIGVVADSSFLSLQSKVANVFLSYAKYIGKMFWPKNLAVFYPYDTGSFVPLQIVLSALLLLIISVLVIYWGRRKKYLFVGWFWFLVTLVPVIGLVQSGAQALADRYTYIPYIGLFIMIAWGLPEFLSGLPHRKIILGISMAIVLTILGICTWIQVSYWKNSSTLFSHALDVTKNNYLAHTGLADDLCNQGQVALAIEHYKKSLQIQPTCAFTHNNLGLALTQQGKYAEAITHFTEAIRLMPDLDKARNNLAKILVMNGQIYEAIDQLRTAIRLRPNQPDFMNAFAFLTATRPELKDRDMNEAIRFASRACELTNYKNTAFLVTLAVAYSTANRFSEAAQTIETALKFEPNSAFLRNGLGNILLSGGKFKEAISQIKRSLEIEPNNSDAKNNMAWILATVPDSNMRNPSEAIRIAQELSSETNYKDSAMLDTLGAAFASAGRFAEAIEITQKAMSLVDKNDKHKLEQFQQHLDLYKVSKPYIETWQKDQDVK